LKCLCPAEKSRIRVKFPETKPLLTFSEWRLRDVCIHPTIEKTAPITENNLDQNIKSAKTVKPQTKRTGPKPNFWDQYKMK
jgi:hypothetical protein